MYEFMLVLLISSLGNIRNFIAFWAKKSVQETFSPWELQSMDTNFLISSTVVSICFNISLISFFGLTFWYLCWRRPENWSKWIEETMAGYNTKSKCSGILIYINFFWKRILVSLLVVSLNLFSYLWIGILIVLINLASLILHFKPKLYSSVFKQSIAILLEFFLLIISSIFLICYNVSNLSSRETVGKWMIHLFTFVQIAASLIGVLEMIWNCILCIRRRVLARR